jgi:hypothetical protein
VIKNLDDSTSRAIPSDQGKIPRVFCLDLLKALGIVAVVSFHSNFLPEASSAGTNVDALFACLRFCVPVLLVISFMLLERSLAGKQNDKKLPLLYNRLLRLLIPSLLWLAIGSGMKLLKGYSLSELLVEALRGNLFVGQYYLNILIVYTPIFFLLRKWFRRAEIFAFSIVTHIGVSLILYWLLYHDSTQVLTLLRSIGRPSPIYWLAYPSLGACLWANWKKIVELSAKISWLQKSLILVANATLMSIEYSWQRDISHGLIPPFDYIQLSTLLSVFTLFISFASLTEDRFLKPIQNCVYFLSKYSFGIFCINGLLSRIFYYSASGLYDGIVLDFPSSLGIRIAGWLVLLVLSSFIAYMIDKIGFGAVVR